MNHREMIFILFIVLLRISVYALIKSKKQQYNIVSSALLEERPLNLTDRLFALSSQRDS